MVTSVSAGSVTNGSSLSLEEALSRNPLYNQLIIN